MRFQFLKPRRDVATVEQVRALRERRGWTAEQLADEVHASPLEVSAWEAEMVAVPSKQALLIRWMADVDTWHAALDAACVESCVWVREHAPDLYERMFRNLAGRWHADSAAVQAHVSGCAACQAALARARQIGAYPAKPDTSGSLLARYRHWADRLPARVRAPFALAGAAVEMILPVAFFVLVAPDMWAGALLAFGAFAVTTNALARVRYRRLAELLSMLATVAAGLLGWSIFPGNDLSNPRPWAFVAVVVGAFWIGYFRARIRKRKAQALASRAAPAPALSPPPPDLAATLQRPRSASTS
jgi:transcriptional regulator with XRE-family HTH domain